jgi:hypothetical protein
MAEKPVMAYVAEAGGIKELVQKFIEKAAKEQKPLSFLAATAENPLQELHLGKTIRKFLAENNGRQGKDWLIRQAPENRYFVVIHADGDYLDGFTAQLDDAFRAASVKAYTSTMSMPPQNGTPAQIAEEVYSGLCAGARSAVEDAVFTPA